MVDPIDTGIIRKEVPAVIRIKEKEEFENVLERAGLKYAGDQKWYDMRQCYGKEFEVGRIVEQDGYTCCQDTNGFWWLEGLFDVVETQTVELYKHKENAVGNNIFAGGKDDSQKEPFHLIPEIVVRELARAVVANGDSQYIWIARILSIGHDADMDLVDILTAIKDVLKFGAEKYSPDSWKAVANAQDRYCGAMIRHMLVRERKEDIDPESGLSHLAHELCNVMFLAWFEIMEDRNNIDNMQ